MTLLITGICGFVGSTLARGLARAFPSAKLTGVDNFIRPGSERNRSALRRLGVNILHGDIRSATDVDALPPADWVLDAAANPSVLAGVDGQSSSRQVIEHNLGGTINLLEYCRRHRAGFILLSTSRVYSIPPLASLPVISQPGFHGAPRFVVAASRQSAAITPSSPPPSALRPPSSDLPAPCSLLPAGLSPAGVSESFSTAPPVSLYGSTKLASEALALEYGATFDFPVWINRCGVLAGAGQFGRADQGIYAFWINAWLRGAPLKYIGFDGTGAQVRDALHPLDLLPVLHRQMTGPGAAAPRVLNFGGGAANAMSLAELSAWCAQRFGPRTVAADPTPRRFDIPWMIMDSTRAAAAWDWQPAIGLPVLLEEIAKHAEANPDWLALSVGD